MLIASKKNTQTYTNTLQTQTEKKINKRSLFLAMAKNLYLDDFRGFLKKQMPDLGSGD